jgi:hypothetical protein
MQKNINHVVALRKSKWQEENFTDLVEKGYGMASEKNSI